MVWEGGFVSTGHRGTSTNHVTFSKHEKIKRSKKGTQKEEEIFKETRY